MKLYAYRALDYVYAASAADRRYLLFCAVQKTRISSEGVKVMALLSECIGAKGFESDMPHAVVSALFSVMVGDLTSWVLKLASHLDEAGRILALRMVQVPKTFAEDWETHRRQTLNIVAIIKFQT